MPLSKKKKIAIGATVGSAGVIAVGALALSRQKQAGPLTVTIHGTVTSHGMRFGQMSFLGVHGLVSGNIPLTVTYTATVTGGISPYSFSWNWGDNSPNSTGNPATHTYVTQGTFTVVCTVKDSIGNTATATDTVQALVTPTLVCLSPSDHLVNTPLTVTAVLKGNGVGLSGEPLVFNEYFNGALFGSYTTSTNSSGVATDTFTPTQVGTWTFVVTFSGDPVKGWAPVKSNTATTVVYAPLEVTISGATGT